MKTAPQPISLQGTIKPEVKPAPYCPPVQVQERRQIEAPRQNQPIQVQGKPQSVNVPRPL